jgi:hypothetical protein
VRGVQKEQPDELGQGHGKGESPLNIVPQVERYGKHEEEVGGEKKVQITLHQDGDAPMPRY